IPADCQRAAAVRDRTWGRDGSLCGRGAAGEAVPLSRLSPREDAVAMNHGASATGIGPRMVICLAVGDDGCIDPRWGRAQRVAIATAENGAITGWEEFGVSWDTLHDTGSEGTHHARVARFLREH